MLVGSGPLVERVAQTLTSRDWVATRTLDVARSVADLGATPPRAILIQPADLHEAAELIGDIRRLDLARRIPILAVLGDAPTDAVVLPPGADAYLIDPTPEDLIEAIGQHVVATWSRDLGGEHALDLIESLGDAVLVVDRAHRIVYHNSSGLALVQRATHQSATILGSLVERALPSFVEGQLQHALRAGLEHGETSHVEQRMGPLWVGLDVFANPDGVTLVARDITERHRLEEALLETRMSLARSEKAALLGELVSGIAHEVRTPLVALGNSLEVLRVEAGRHAETPNPASATHIRESIQQAWVAWERAVRIMKELQRITRLDPAVHAHVDLSVAMEDAITLFAAIDPGASRVRAHLEPGLRVRADVRKLQQVALNLLQNAVDATAGSATLVDVATRRLPDGRAALVVQDAGPGMPPSVVDRMYDPLFTTKQGATGLGLGIVHRIVGEHGGTIVCDTAPGRGTAFTITLPIVTEVVI
ncbi:MAG TPA: ATP-binding protein [Candidatus Thermoplasmatota archaeon]|nr:ATP-binding protein [Candidatus Thermoplasmatota archaeon]